MAAQHQLTGVANMINRPSEFAFQNAIDKGCLTEQTAYDWMYMYSKDKGDEVPEIVDYFKHIDTREYMQVAA